MAIAIALDDDLVGAAPQHRASAPVLAPVDLIAKGHGKWHRSISRLKASSSLS
jgi:hypothetical protein